MWFGEYTWEYAENLFMNLNFLHRSIPINGKKAHIFTKNLTANCFYWIPFLQLLHIRFSCFDFKWYPWQNFPAKVTVEKATYFLEPSWPNTMLDWSYIYMTCCFVCFQWGYHLITTFGNDKRIKWGTPVCLY